MSLLSSRAVRHKTGITGKSAAEFVVFANTGVLICPRKNDGVFVAAAEGVCGSNFSLKRSNKIGVVGCAGGSQTLPYRWHFLNYAGGHTLR